MLVTPAPEQIATWTDLARAQATKSQASGAILMYGVPIVVIAENDNYLSPGEQLLQSRGVQVIVCNDARCISMMGDWIKANPAIWNEDVAGDIEGARSAVDCFSTLVHGSLDGDHR
ncbi:hypothetical protein WJX84_010451 [Apatococcus fuscideae]|uniref:Uncharacterized protein n=1 Tax=Apatococcus fuscideae TaxID=2026836 RepID=A0AAW1TBE1_9CHLO